MTSTNQKSVLTSLHRFEFILQHELDQFLRGGAGISFSQMRIMDEISANIPRSQHEIALRLYQTEANVSRQLKELKARGLVKIQPSKKDKRQKDVWLSSTGQKKHAAAQKIMTTQHKLVLSSLGAKDLQTFDHSINKLTRAVAGVSLEP